MVADLRAENRDGQRLLLYGLSALGLVFLTATFIPPHGYDLISYWLVNVDYANVTDLSGQGPFRYAPPIALAMTPLRSLPWEALVVLWLALQLAALWYIGGRWTLALIIFPPVWLDLVYGNINIMLAAVIVAGFRYPAVWSFALLTKVTPGVGLVWFAVRREWRSLALAIGATAAIIGVSIVIQGVGAWQVWLRFLTTSSAMPLPGDALPIPLLPRLIVATLIVALGGLTDRRWLVPVGVVVAMPTLWVIAFAPLVAIAGIQRDPSRGRLATSVMTG